MTRARRRRPRRGSTPPINALWSCAIARLLLYRIKAPLPAATDVRGLGQYWKTYFNTPAGGGTVDEFVTKFTNRIGAPPDA